MPPTRVACVGLGGLGRLELSLFASMDDVDVVGVADPDPGARTVATDVGAASYADHGTLLAAEAVDAVSIASPHARHFEGARAALAAGCDVHVEKPMVTDAGHARELVALADERDLTLAVGYQRHFDPRFRELRRVIDAGRIGDPHAAACHLEQFWIAANHDGWRGDPDLSGGGQLYDSGSHLLDALLWTTRTTPRAVSAEIDRRGYDVDVNAALSVQLEREDGGRVTASVGVTGAGRTAPDTGEALHVWGTDGAVSFDGTRLRVREGAAAGGATYESTPPDPGFEELTRRKLRNFLDAAAGDATLKIPARDALSVTALTEAAYESAANGERVAVDASAGGDPDG
jgi:predicted dehydrogenase